MNKKIVMGLLIIFTLMMGISSVNAGLFDFMSESPSSDLNVSNIEIVDKGYYMYDVNCEITPKKDFNYLEMYVIFYDSDNAVIEKSSLVWNINSPTKDQLIKVNGNAYMTNQNANPARAEVFITDSVGDNKPEDAIFAQNVTMS